MFHDQQFIVTGASSGIGAEVVLKLLNRSIKVIGISRSINKKTDTGKKKGMLETISCDLSDINGITKIFSDILKSSNRLDGAVLCHGYGDFGALEQFSDKKIINLINTNLISNILIAKQIIPIMKKTRLGNIIFVGSESSLKAGKKGAVYCASKFGLRGLSQSLRKELCNSGIRVSIVNPGMVDTPFFDELDFEPGKDDENYILAKHVADAIMSIIEMTPRTVIDEINLSPLKTVIRNKNKKTK